MYPLSDRPIFHMQIRFYFVNTTYPCSWQKCGRAVHNVSSLAMTTCFAFAMSVCVYSCVNSSLTLKLQRGD